MARTILELPLDQVIRDEQQVRRYLDDGAGLRPLRDAIERWGQLHPIRVRPEGGKFVIVDGERRWRAMRQLRDRARKEGGGEARFEHIQAIVGGQNDEDPQARRAIQVVSNMGAHLLPFEKARVVADLRRSAKEKGEKLRHEEIAKMLGISRGQIQHLLELSKAPEFILEFGKPRSFQVLQDEDADEDGNVVTKTVRREALTTPFLRQLHITFKKLAAHDQRQLRWDPQHRPRAAQLVRQLGLRAQREQWTFRDLQSRAKRLAERTDAGGGSRRSRPRETALLEKLALAASQLTEGDCSALGPREREVAAELVDRLSRWLRPEGNDARTT